MSEDEALVRPGVSDIGVPLAGAIEALRGELVAALEASEGEDVRFALGPIELEFQVELSRESAGEAGVKFWVVALGGKGSRSSATTHTVRLSLSPVLAAEISTSRPLVVGSEQARQPR
jgi:hypothetical protein